MFIVIGLLIWIGVQLNAPAWYIWAIIALIGYELLFD